jgi:hypothetical protein
MSYFYGLDSTACHSHTHGHGSLSLQITRTKQHLQEGRWMKPWFPVLARTGGNPRTTPAAVASPSHPFLKVLLGTQSFRVLEERGGNYPAGAAVARHLRFR